VLARVVFPVSSGLGCVFCAMRLEEQEDEEVDDVSTVDGKEEGDDLYF